MGLAGKYPGNFTGMLHFTWPSHISTLESGRRGGTLSFDQRLMVAPQFPPGQPPKAETIRDSEQKTSGKEVNMEGAEAKPGTI